MRALMNSGYIILEVKYTLDEKCQVIIRTDVLGPSTSALGPTRGRMAPGQRSAQDLGRHSYYVSIYQNCYRSNQNIMSSRSRMYSRTPARRYTRSAYTRRATTRRRTTNKRSNLRFATVGYTRNIERKYSDKTYKSNALSAIAGTLDGEFNIVDSLMNGAMFKSSTGWTDYNFNGLSVPQIVSNDMLKGVNTGATATTRIGNKIKVEYIKGAFTFTAATLKYNEDEGAAPGMPQGGEQAPLLPTEVGNVSPYLRTTYRFVIVKDMQVNSTDTQITWDQVFESTAAGGSGVHSELRVDNMGRFIVLQDKIFTLDADDPQKTCPFTISGRSVGNVRYNGSTVQALTDKGVYVIWAAYVMGTRMMSNFDHIAIPSPVGHSRLCFTDD